MEGNSLGWQNGDKDEYQWSMWLKPLLSGESNRAVIHKLALWLLPNSLSCSKIFCSPSSPYLGNHIRNVKSIKSMEKKVCLSLSHLSDLVIFN